MNTDMAPPGGSFLIDDAGDFLTPEQLPSDTLALAEAASDFFRRGVLPLADRLQTQEAGLMASLLRKAGELGLMGLEVPEEYGGLALPKSASARIAEALALEPSFAVSHNVHTSVATLPIVFFGTPEQKQRYLPRLATGEWIGGYALSEAHAGSDAMALRTRAVPSADGQSYTLTGEKMWITNAGFADLFVVFAKVEGQAKLSAFLIERETNGVSIGREEHKLGLKGSSTCRLLLDGVEVPAGNLLGGEGNGAKVALYTLNLGRFKIAASSLGQAKNLLGIATRYAKQRFAFGQPLSELGLIQEKLARMAAKLFACECMLYRVAGYLDAAFASHPSSPIPHPSEEYAVECAMLKVACTEALDYCADECLQIHGGYGYTEEFPAARAWRDARVNRIYEGANEINRLNVVQLLLKRVAAGRLDLSRGPNLRDYFGQHESSIEILRVICLTTLEASREEFGETFVSPQEVCGILADMLIGLFAADSAEQRSKRILESGLSETRWQAAFTAARLLRMQTETKYRDAIDTIYGSLDNPNLSDLQNCIRLLEGRPHPSIRLQRTLARAVIDADGYCW